MPLPSRDQLGSISWHLQRLHGTGISPPSATSEPPVTPKKVPPTPNNTPATTPAVSPTKSLGTAVKDTKKTAKMAKQKPTRGRSRSRSDSGSPEKKEKEKRHLCRWDADMDQKLLLSFQYASNVAGLTIPWEEIGRVTGPGITGSAVVQHLAKTRVRMQGRGLEVPPPLRRGGGSGNSRVPAAGTATTPTKAATANKSKPKAKTNAKSTPRKAKKAAKKGNALSDDSDSGSEQDWEDDNSDAEYGQPAAKRAKTTKGPVKRKIKTEDSDEDTPPSKAKATKRKATNSKPSEERSAYGYTDINGKPIDEDESSSELVGAGQPWLEYGDDEDHLSDSSTSKKTPVKKTLVVALPTTPVKTDVFKANHENNAVGDVQDSLDKYQVENQQILGDPFISDPFANNSTVDSVNTNGYGGAYGNVGGFQTQDPNHDGTFTGSFGIDGGFDVNIPNALDTDMAGGGAIPDAYNFGSGNTVPYPIQTSWPEYQGSMGSSSFYPSVAQTPAGGSAGPDFNFFPSVAQTPAVGSAGPDFGFYPSVAQTPAAPSAGPDFSNGYFGDSQFDMGAFNDGSYGYMANNGNVFNAGDIDGNFIDDGFFGNNSYGN